jgi:hypothetical protein
MSPEKRPSKTRSSKKIRSNRLKSFEIHHSLSVFVPLSPLFPLSISFIDLLADRKLLGVAQSAASFSAKPF